MRDGEVVAKSVAAKRLAVRALPQAELLERLADVPTPFGVTPRQISIPAQATLLPILDAGFNPEPALPRPDSVMLMPWTVLTAARTWQPVLLRGRPFLASLLAITAATSENSWCCSFVSPTCLARRRSRRALE